MLQPSNRLVSSFHAAVPADQSPDLPRVSRRTGGEPRQITVSLRRREFFSLEFAALRQAAPASNTVPTFISICVNLVEIPPEINLKVPSLTTIHDVSLQPWLVSSLLTRRELSSSTEPLPNPSFGCSQYPPCIPFLEPLSSPFRALSPSLPALLPSSPCPP